MPQKSNIVGDLGTTKVASDSYDVDNIYLSEEGWVYRHYKKADKSKWWDEIIVAGEVPAGDSPEATNPPKLGTAAAPTFESGDSIKDFEYSPLYGNTATGGGVPNFNGGGDAGPPAVTIGIATLSGNDDPTEGTTETYTVSWDGNIEVDPTITWQILAGSGTIVSGQGTTSVDVEFTGTSTVQLAVAVTSDAASDTPRGAGMELFITAAPAPPAPVTYTLNLTGAQAGNTAYTAQIDGGAVSDNPSVTMNQGDTLVITNNSGGHAVIITESDGGSTTTDGTITGSNPADDGETLTWDTTSAAAGTYYYQCQDHTAMIGTITLNAA